jgi:MIP family channel proteins
MRAKLFAEGIATFTLVFIGAGAICANALTDGALGLTGIALAHGLAILVMVYATAHISGAHINPAVTIAMITTRNIDGKTGALYIVSQLAGGVVAALTLSCLYPDFVSAAPFLGNPEMNPALTHLTPVCGMFVEAILTFLLVFVIFGVAVDNRGIKPALGLAIGLTVTLDILMGGPITGAAMNPARAFGTALMTGRWADHAVYWVGPIVGGIAAGWTYTKCYLKT